MSEHAESSAAAAMPPPRYETADITRPFVLIASGLLLACVLALAALAAALYPGSRSIGLVRTELEPPPEGPPALQSSPRVDMARYREQEMRELNGAGWVDRERGVVHIPIARAMRQLATDGIAGWPRR